MLNAFKRIEPTILFPVVFLLMFIIIMAAISMTAIGIVGFKGFSPVYRVAENTRPKYPGDLCMEMYKMQQEFKDAGISTKVRGC